ncbi:MAG: magnesium transporter [Victivallales bacterium]|nr:magnesium transporter [Victivallales bacterium]
MDNTIENTDVGLSEELTSKLLTLSEQNNLKEIREILADIPPADAAKAMELFAPDRQLALFRSLSKDTAAEIFTYVDSDLRVHIVESVAQPEVNEKIKQDFQELFDTMPVDDAADLLDELPANLVEALLKNSTPDKRKQLNDILNYPPNSAGSLMTLEYIMLSETMTVEEALKHVRSNGRTKETIYNCYAVSKGRKLAGAVSLREIVLSKEGTLIRDIMATPVIYAHTMDDQEKIAEQFKEYDLLAMPVVDMENRLVGIITIDDVVDVIEAENTEDFEKMAALRPSDDEYLKTSVLTLARNRIVWLMVLMISATFTGAIISHFQKILQEQVILASFIPMLMDTGGNCGAQVSTLVIRGMAVGDIELVDWFKIVWKEIRVGLTVGAALCLANTVRMLIFARGVSPSIIIVVNVALFITVTFAKMIGCLLPMTAKRLKLDPALMASPMISTIVDAFALVTYFMVAHQLIK